MRDTHMNIPRSHGIFEKNKKKKKQKKKNKKKKKKKIRPHPHHPAAAGTWEITH